MPLSQTIARGCSCWKVVVETALGLVRSVCFSHKFCMTSSSDGKIVSSASFPPLSGAAKTSVKFHGSSPPYFKRRPNFGPQKMGGGPSKIFSFKWDLNLRGTLILRGEL